MMGLPKGDGDVGPTSDSEIRLALHNKKLKRVAARPDTLIVEELGLAHAKARIDIAVIDGCVHGFEIKSSLDTLARLSKQMAFYEECLQKLTIVCAERHLEGVRKLVPSWCGILVVTKGPRGGVDFASARLSRRNPNVRPDRLAHLLWRQEAVELLIRFNAPVHILRSPRKQLYRSLAELMTVEEITASIRQFMAARRDWRGLGAHALCGG
jgi:hypothetical protein